MRYLVGVDGGGTRTTIVVAEESGREILRRDGAAGLVDPRRPAASAAGLALLVRQALSEAALDAPAAALCAGLAGVGNLEEREVVRSTLAAASLAERVHVISDGEIALEGAFLGGPGILLIAGTGSVAYGRAEDGRIERCGGWGMVVGDEGSGYAIGRAALAAALRAVDGRGANTWLLPTFLEHLGLSTPRGIPPWAGRAEKGEIAALVPHVVRVAEEGDAVAREVLQREARELAQHAVALVHRLGPWSTGPSVVFFGGVFRSRIFAQLVHGAILAELPGVQLRESAADAVAGALRYAAQCLDSPL
ncbi:MAG TPA: BadF/BadG/BcrA/BcrD ATPase family protein [Longimicrobiaceae bacterium]|nr:BadF/BadG/BcrA/BcrD ATPase family protein [Longimicrobiaceae bacterium]